jgi:hypothetical protein
MRPAPAEAVPAPAVDFVLFGKACPAANDAVWAAWDRAGNQGIGAPRRRPFQITATVPLAWDGTPLRPARIQPGFTLVALRWPLGSLTAGCRLDFPAPLRLIYRGRLIQEPALPDLIVAALRRIHALAGPEAGRLWAVRHEWLELARGFCVAPGGSAAWTWCAIPVRRSGKSRCRVSSARSTCPTDPAHSAR